MLNNTKGNGIAREHKSKGYSQQGSFYLENAMVNERLSSIEKKIEALTDSISGIREEIKPLIALKIVWGAIPKYIRSVIKVGFLLIVLKEFNGVVALMVNDLHLGRLLG